MNLRNKRKASQNQRDENEIQYGQQDTINHQQQHDSSDILNDVEKNFVEVQSNQISKNGEVNRNTDAILASGGASKKKLKTNSGTGLVQNQHNIQNACLKSAEEIIQHQQHINNDCNIDCDGFREIYPEDLHTQLQEALFTEQTIVLRNAAGPEGYNVNSKNLFEFESVVKNHGSMEIECRIQNPTVYGFNIDNPRNSQHIYHTSIQEYGEYAQLLNEDNYDQIKKKSYYKDYFSKLGNGVMFAVNIDMDDTQWNSENMRIRSSLPHYLLNKGKHDILSYHRQNVMGCTQPQMYLKVAGVWTGGHQENISVRAININHGDGESDWYCIDFDQVEKYRNFIKKKHGVDIHQNEGLWFGKYNDPEVAKAGIKIKKVIQRKNDIVILAPGVLHWVRCRGRSVQTAWNFAYRKLQDIIAMNERFVYNQKINFETVILNKALFMDLLNFEYHNLPSDACNRLYEIVSEYYEKEVLNEGSILHQPLKSKNQVIFYDQLPAQLKHIQIYYCNEDNCNRELFCYFGVFRSQFSFLEQRDMNQSDFCGKYYCPRCILEMKKIDDQIIIFRKFDLNSLRQLLKRVQNFLKKKEQQPLYPIQDLTNIGHFCGQIQNINDFIFNKDIRRLEQVYIPDAYHKQGVEEMQKFQQDLQQNRLLDFAEKPILKFITPIQTQRYEDIPVDQEQIVDSNNFLQNLKSHEDEKNKQENQKIQTQLNKESTNQNEIQTINKSKTKTKVQMNGKSDINRQNSIEEIQIKSKSQKKNDFQMKNDNKIDDILINKDRDANESDLKQNITLNQNINQLNQNEAQLINNDRMDIEINQQDNNQSLQKNSSNNSDETNLKQQDQENIEITNNNIFNQNGSNCELFESTVLQLPINQQTSQQQEDEKLAFSLYLQDIQNTTRTTRQQNSKKEVPSESVSQKNTSIKKGRKKRVIQSNEQSSNQDKKSPTLDSSQMTPSQMNLSVKSSDKPSEILSPVSSSTISGMIVKNTYPNINQEQTQIANDKKNKTQSEQLPKISRINNDKIQMKSDNTIITPKTSNEQKNDEQNLSQCGFKIIPESAKQTIVPNIKIFENQKIKIIRKTISEDDGEDDEETKKQKKIREQQKLQNLKVFENGFCQMNQQNETNMLSINENKNNQEIMRSTSSELDETEILYKKSTLQQIENSN